MKLVDDWKNLWRMWSVRINVIFATIAAAVASFPEIFLQLWVLIPMEIQQQILSIEGIASIFTAILLSSAIARSVKQEKLHAKPDKEDEEKPKEDV